MHKTRSPSDAGVTRLPVRLALTAFVLISASTKLASQSAWDAILSIDPYPSPYYSDWDNNPNIASLTVINPGAATQVRIHFNVTNRANKVVLSGSSDPQNIGARATVIFDNPYDVAGSTHHDEEEERIASRTGRLREGEYTACAVVADLTGFSLAESCTQFTIVYPDPPLLLSPANRDVITETDPLFQWTPVQVPVDFQLSYVMRVVEILNGQTPQEALRANIPHYQSLDGQFSSLRYPIDARPFEVGKQYAWTVQVLDQNGYAASGNDGRSEIWTFRFDDEEPAVHGETVNVLFVNTDAKGDAVNRADYSGSLEDICAKWGQQLDLSVAIDITGKRAFPPSMVLNDAHLVRADTVAETHGRRQWVIYGQDPGRDVAVMLSGDCGVDNETTRRRWVGRRPIADAEELANWIPTSQPLAHQDSLAKLKFGVRILSWFQEKAGEKALAPVKEFLEQREVEVKPGVNYFGVLDARQTAIWNVINVFPFDEGDAEIELEAFLGVDAEYKASVSFGSEKKWAVGAEGEVDMLVLHATMPERRLPNDLVRTVRFGAEIAIGIAGEAEASQKDSEAKASVQGAIKLIVTALVTARDKKGVEWEGELELPFALERGGGKTEKKFEPTLTLKSEFAWPPGEDVDLKIGHPELEIKISEELGNLMKSNMRVGLEGTLKGALILFDEDVATVGVTLERKGDKTRAAKLVELGEELVKSSQAALDNAKKTGNAEEIAKYERTLEKSKRLLKRNEEALKLEEAEAKKLGSAYKPAVAKGETHWKASLELGNMSLVNLLDLIQKIGLAVK